MGERGPLRQEGLKRRKSRQDAIDAAAVTVEAGGQHPAPHEPDEDWHPVAVETYLSFERSGQTALFQPSDWMKLWLACEHISRELKPQFVGMEETYELFEDGRGEEHLMPVKKAVAGKLPLKGSSLTAIQAIMASLGMSYGDRQRLNVELKAPGADKAEDTVAQAMKDLEQAMRGGNVVPFERPATGSS